MTDVPRHCAALRGIARHWVGPTDVFDAQDDSPRGPSLWRVTGGISESVKLRGSVLVNSHLVGVSWHFRGVCDPAAKGPSGPVGMALAARTQAAACAIKSPSLFPPSHGCHSSGADCPASGDVAWHPAGPAHAQARIRRRARPGFGTRGRARAMRRREEDANTCTPTGCGSCAGLSKSLPCSRLERLTPACWPSRFPYVRRRPHRRSRRPGAARRTYGNLDGQHAGVKRSNILHGNDLERQAQLP